MTEETLFAAALEKATPAERSAFLDEACSGDSTLRRRVEALLESHAQAEFMKTPAIQHAAELLDGESDARTVAAESTDDDPADVVLRFLGPSEKADSLGRLGHYEILEVVGRGGMGIVLRGFDEKLLRVVAIKVMAESLASSTAARRRFTREAQAAAAVCHDHIVTIHAVEEANGLPYLVMHFVAGMSLQDRIDRGKPLQLAEILRIGMQTASGLAAAHAQGLIHRDIKPANILLENGIERVKITDFGLARAADDASLTQSGVVAGTPQYMAPEQARGESVDQRADLFSLGSVLYAMCTGRAPFRASGTMAVLNRVCNEMPSPIREASPEVPDWLVTIIEKLHAKNPADRYQTAREVADVLGQHLAHVQHPSVVPLPAVPAPIPPQGNVVLVDERSHKGRRRWAIAIVAMLLLLGSLSLTEATGVTDFATNVIRVLTPAGTLVVETGDPGVKVTVEGDGGVFITGTDLAEIRLRPGSYRIHADRDGRRVPLERELVSIARGGREVVRVKMEGGSLQAAGPAEQGAFVLLAAGKELRFNGLAEAIQGASDGDTIEVRGNGPFDTEPITIRNTALTLRAADGFQPAIRLSESAERACKTLLRTSAALRLEGIEFQRQSESPPEDKVAWPSLVHADGSALHVANCRFVSNTRQSHKLDFITPESTVCLVRNCEFIGKATVAMGATFAPCRRLDVENCVHLGEIFLAAECGYHPRNKATTIRMSRNTVVARDQLGFFVAFNPPPERLQEAEAYGAIPVETLENIFDVGVQMQFGQGRKSLEPPAVEALLLRVLSWRDRGNLLNAPGGFFMSSVGEEAWGPLRPKTLAQWREFWGQPDASVSEGTMRFSGGDLSAKLAAGPHTVKPEDFRLRPDSAGYRAGKDGNDIGADVDLVGPGPAYERWKKTPDYRQWIGETGQSAAANPEPGAFVVVGGPGIEERKFDALDQAVFNSTEGDTIEIRGNGPFVTGPITIGAKALTIRAGPGFRPVLRFLSEKPNEDLISTSARLVLEGLELREVTRKRQPIGQNRMIIGTGNFLQLANCRLLQEGPQNDRLALIMARSNIRLRNCEFYSLASIANGANDDPLRVEMENCIGVGGLVTYVNYAPMNYPANVIYRRNTLVAYTMAATGFSAVPKRSAAGDGGEFSRVRFESVATVFDNRGSRFNVEIAAARTGTHRETRDEAEQVLASVIEWREQGNVSSPTDTTIGWRSIVNGVAGPFAFADRKESERIWGLTNTGSLEGQIRFQGGDLMARMHAHGGEKLTPDDFRLRADSAGYRAGDEGKDLGADVNLVGPGPAYERWKAAPDYQKWLIESQPVK